MVNDFTSSPNDINVEKANISRTQTFSSYQNTDAPTFADRTNISCNIKVPKRPAQEVNFNNTQDAKNKAIDKILTDSIIGDNSCERDPNKLLDEASKI